MTRFLSFTPLASVTLALFGAVYADAQDNLLSNGRFENRGEVQTMQIRSCESMSSAKGWTTWIQAIGCVEESGVEMTTDLLLGPPGQLYSAPTYLMHVRTRVTNPLGMGDAGNSGIAQTFNTSAFHGRVLASVWIFVVRGQVGLGVGFYRNTKTTVRSSKIGEWERLVGVNARDTPTQVVVFGVDQRGSEFYVADAVVCPADTDEELAACHQRVDRHTPPEALSGSK